MLKKVKRGNKFIEVFDIKAKCTFENKIYEKIIKNPHTTHFFCDIKNIEICENDKCPDGVGYIFYRRPKLPLHKNNILQNLNLLKSYKKDKLPITLNDIEDKIKFYYRKQLPASTVHWGQIKLFLSTLQFLLDYCPKDKDVNILYVGSAEGHNLPLLVDMFPKTNWYLVDPRKDKKGQSVFDKRLFTIPRVKKIVVDFFTDELANKMKKELNKKYFLFISDIRLFEATNRNEKEKDIDTDMKLQLGWYHILNPDYSQLKFRIPYYAKKYDYLEGKIYLQDFAPVSSTETRLVVSKNAKMKKYLLSDYENKLFYFNRLLRTSYYKHNYNIKNMDHCYDCTKYLTLINKYNERNPEYFKGKSMRKTIKHVILEIRTTDVLERETNKLYDQIISH